MIAAEFAAHGMEGHMAISHVLKSGSLTALAAALAALALPVAAFAQDGDGNRRGDRSEQVQRDGGSARSERGAGWQSRRSQPAAQAAQPVPQAQGRRERGNGWSQRSTPNAAPPVTANAAPPRRTWPGVQTENRRQADRGQAGQAESNPGWNGRNRSYSDPNRNGTYRENARDGRRSDQSTERRDNNGGWRGQRRDDNPGWRGNNHRNDDNRGGWNNNRDNRGGWNNNRDNRSWNRDWRRDGRYNWNGYRSSNRGHYRLDPYYAPYRGYSYRRLGIGFTLDALFFGNRYWIDDPWSYRLPDVYGPYRWVRYYDDVVLVDIYSGEVVDVIHDFFW